MLINRVFYKNFHTGPSSDSYNDVQIDPHRCSLGRRLDGDGLVYRDLPEYSLELVRLLHNLEHTILEIEYTLEGVTAG